MAERAENKKIDWLHELGKSSKIPFGMFDMLTASFFINVLSLAMPLALLQIYDRIIPNTSANTLAILVGGICVALLLEALLRIGRSYLSGWVGARFEHIAGCASLERLISTSVNDFEKEGSGVHLERMDSLGTLKEFYAGQAIMTLFDLPFAVLFLMVISYLAGTLVLVPIILIITFALAAIKIGNKLRGALAERNIADERRFNFIIEVLGGIHTLKSMAMETQMLRRYERLQETCAKSDYHVTLNSSSAMSLGAIYSQLTMFAIVGFGSTYVIDGDLTVGGLAACTMLSGRAMQPLQRAVGIWARFQSIQLAREKLRQIFELQPETEGGLPMIGSDFIGQIELQDIELAFDKDAEPLFSNVNLKVEPGEIIGISGGNASGKSSLLYIMMGAMRPTKGRVLINGLDLNEIDPSSVRKKIAYLPQHGVLFNGTILDNLTMFKPELDEKALRIARVLGLDDAVVRMPMGYDTPVGNGAYDSLPRGIKQRVAIGRALMSDPVVLLFDEANSAMDSAGDKVLTQFLEDARGKRTLILVSHRPSLLRMADKVYDLSDGVFQPRKMEPFNPPVAQPPAKAQQTPPAKAQQTPPAGGQAPAQPDAKPPVKTEPSSQAQPQPKPKPQPQPQDKAQPASEQAGGKAETGRSDEDKSKKKQTKSSKVQIIPPKNEKGEEIKDYKPKFVLKKRDKDQETQSKPQEGKDDV